MDQYHYDPTCKKDVDQYKYLGMGQQIDIPLRITVPGPGTSGAPVYTPIEQLALTANRLLCMFGDQLAECLVIQAHLHNYQALRAAESELKIAGCPAATAYYNNCVKAAVERMSAKPYG